MPPSRTSRAFPIASVDTTAGNADANAALLGASLAFGRSTPASRSPSLTATLPKDDHGLLAAAYSADIASKIPSQALSRSPRPTPRSTSLSSSAGSVGGQNVKEKASMDFANMPHLLPPPQQARPTSSRSPSQQAAVLAAARARPLSSTVINSHEQQNRTQASTVAKPPIAPKPRRLSGSQRRTNSLDHADNRPTDSTSIAPTTSLVDLFEQRSKEASRSQGKRPEPVVVKPSTDLPIQSPKPVRSGITSMFKLELGNESQDRENNATEPVKKAPRASDRRNGHSSDDSYTSASEDMNSRSPRLSPPKVPSRVSKTSSSSPGQTLKVQNDAKRRPAVSPPPLLQSTTNPIQIKQPARPATAGAEMMSLSSPHSVKSIPAQYHQAYPRKMTPLTTGDQLANALVASSLASSRAPSPMKDAPPLPTRKKHYKMSLSSRTPSPAKVGMLRTLRKQDDSDNSSEEDENARHPYGHHRKRRLIRKHPNKHHEGDRKRWRDAVTERERKRYEGVWAANKGLHYSFTYEEQKFFRRAPNHEQTENTKAVASEQVSNIIARDIWNRSRLPEDILEMVWDLVDTDSVGRLHKEEFVVGMWLIDQRLKGRKLPTRVSETVWASVRSIHGIKIKKR